MLQLSAWPVVAPTPPLCGPDTPGLGWTRSAERMREAYTSAPHVADGNGTSDKMGYHHYQVMYHAVLAPMVLNRCQSRGPLRMLEIGLGCGSFGIGRSSV